MATRIKLIAVTFSSSLLMLIFLCLGSQNLEKRHKINLIVNKTAPLPTGFLVGVSFTLGFISGGFTKLLQTKEESAFN